MSRYRIIVNPAANRGDGKRAIPEIESRLSGLGLDFDLLCTERPWHAADLAQEAVVSGVDVVVAAGGDGTANEVLNGLMRARQAGREPCAMGILCVGRGNDFAYGVGIPPDLDAGCRVLAEGTRRLIDVGLVEGGLYPEGRYFGNGIGIGFEVSRPRIFGLIPHFLRGTQATQEPVRTVQTNEMVVTALEGVLPAHADGETLCIDGQKLAVRLLPQQIQILTAKSGAGELEAS